MALARLELVRDAHELLQVLDTPVGLDRALGLERFDVAGAFQHQLEQRRHPETVTLGRDALNRREELVDGFAQPPLAGQRLRRGRRASQRVRLWASRVVAQALKTSYRRCRDGVG